MARPRIAWFSPLQPVESGISLSSEDLVPILAQVLNIDVVVDGYEPISLTPGPGIDVLDYRRFDPTRYDLVVYQVGNNPAHIYMLDEMARTPGLLVLHDTVLNHLFIQQPARNGTLYAYRDEMARLYGEAGVRAADRVLKGQAPDNLFRFPMSESLVQASPVTIVHSEYARQEARRTAPDASVVRVPHGLRMPQQVDRTSARRALDLAEDQFLVTSVTHINPHKRIDVVLRAFKRLRRHVPARLILAGSVSSGFPLERLISHLGLDQVVDRPGYVPDEQARLIAAASDVIVNLRYPTAGETSASLLRSMAAARPVLVSDTGSFSEVPEDCVIRVPVDALEEQMLLAVLDRLYVDPGLGLRIGRNARRFVKQEHSLQRWADGYMDVIRGLTGLSIPDPDAPIAEEPIPTDDGASRIAVSDPLTSSIARDVAELGLGGAPGLLEDIARSRVELGLGVGMMSFDADRSSAQAGGNDDREHEEANQR